MDGGGRIAFVGVGALADVADGDEEVAALFEDLFDTGHRGSGGGGDMVDLWRRGRGGDESREVGRNFI